nr:Macrolide export ATP-binding/permease protein MacB [Cupriavidus sp.]
MRLWIALAAQSAWARRGPLSLVVAAISVAVFLVLAISQLRQDARESFADAVSGVDLIVGARASPTELLLYSVFHLGRPVRSMAYDHVEAITNLESVAWAVPVQLGDSYRGYPVVGTTPLFFEKTGGAGGLAFISGKAFANVFDAVLGADLAKRFGLKTGDALVLTHGKGDGLAQDHSDRPFTVSGVLQKTGTPADNAVFISLAGFEAIHIGWEFGSKPRESVVAELSAADLAALQPSQVTAVLVGLQSRIQVFSARRAIEGLAGGRLMAILPGVTLDELWQLMRTVENTLSLMAWLVAVSALLGVAATLLIALGARRKELAIFRALGARPSQLSLFVVFESVLVCMAGLVLGWLLLQLAVLGAGDWVRSSFGVMVAPRLPDAQGWAALVGLLCMSVLASAIPAWRAFRLSVHDGLHPPTV